MIGPGVDAQGISINTMRNAFRIGRFIFVPVCVEQEATVGQWSIQIKTNLQSDATEETIMAVFQVR